MDFDREVTPVLDKQTPWDGQLNTIKDLEPVQFFQQIALHQNLDPLILESLNHFDPTFLEDEKSLVLGFEDMRGKIKIQRNEFGFIEKYTLDNVVYDLRTENGSTLISALYGTHLRLKRALDESATLDERLLEQGHLSLTRKTLSRTTMSDMINWTDFLSQGPIEDLEGDNLYFMAIEATTKAALSTNYLGKSQSQEEILHNLNRYKDKLNFWSDITIFIEANINNLEDLLSQQNLHLSGQNSLYRITSDNILTGLTELSKSFEVLAHEILKTGELGVHKQVLNQIVDAYIRNFNYLHGEKRADDGTIIKQGSTLSKNYIKYLRTLVEKNHQNFINNFNYSRKEYNL